MSDKKTSRAYSCECGKSYKERSGLWKHKKICNYEEPEVKEDDENTKIVNVLKETHVLLLHQNKMLKENIMFLENNNILNDNIVIVMSIVFIIMIRNIRDT